MNHLLLVWSYLKAKPFNTLLNGLLLSLGISVITIILLFSHQLNEKISQNSRGIDLVVGAKGSPLQLILCSVFHIDFPTGNINLLEAKKLMKHRLVKTSVPLALGDSYQNFRIVGTTPDYISLYQGTLSMGSGWKEDLEVVLGAAVARRLKLNIGDTFASAHGLTKQGHPHGENKYKVAGILEQSHSVMDNLILTSIGSIWKVHDKSDVIVPDSVLEITSLLIKYKNPIAAIQLPRYINAQTKMQAASPAFEISRLFSILGVGVDVMIDFAYILLFISALSIFIALYNSLRDRRFDLAVLRAMGASRKQLLLSVIMEGSFLTFMGSCAGLIMGHLALFVWTEVFIDRQSTGITAYVFYPFEIFILGGSLLLGLICSVIPAIQAYKTDIHKVLAGD